MINKKTILAIILARGGSKRLPEKNILSFCGKPLIAWTIEAAKKSKYIDRIIVSTDSRKIAKISKQFGAEVPFLRPVKLAQDLSTSESAIIHALERIGQIYDYFILLQPTSPLRTQKHIDEAIEKIIKDPKVLSLESIVKVKGDQSWLKIVDHKGYLKNPFGSNSSDKYLYLPNGAIFISKVEIFLRTKSLYNKTIGYPMDFADSVDIDDKFDLELAECFFKQREKKRVRKHFFIGRNKIVNYGDVFIIAEAGVNHNGELEKALKLVDIAAESGADAVKFQTFKAHQVATKEAELAGYQKRNIDKTTSQLEMLEELELSEEFYEPIIKRCRQKKILFLSTPHGGRESVDFLQKAGIPAYKIGSGDLNNYILLKEVAKTKKPIILSSGMANLAEIKDAIDFIKSMRNNKISVLHCTTSYPCSLEEVNLLAMATMMKELDVPVGYSDHTQDIQTAIMAACMGTAIYECHFTLDKSLPGPDQAASCSPGELKERVEAIRKAKVILGNFRKQPTKNEEKFMINIVRKSIVAVRDLSIGHVLTEKDIEAKRPGTGMSPVFYQRLIGRKLKRAVRKDEQILFRDI